VLNMRIRLIAILLASGGGIMRGGGCEPERPATQDPRQEVRLPAPRTSGAMSVEEAVHARRSVRDFQGDPLDLATVSQLLWATQGITDGNGFRSVPSAGAAYPLEIRLVAGAVEGLSPGVYRYRPHRHSLSLVESGDRRRAVARAALDQGWIADAPVTILVAGVFHRTTGRYGERGRQYVHMEVGHASQNVYLQAVALGLGTTVVGAFRDGELATAAGLEAGEDPLALLPVGVPR
jgi:SagB-type dehydrogenase family enzyme